MAADIRHTIRTTATEDEVVRALLDPAHVKHWWSREAHMDDGCLVVSWSGHGWEVALETAWTPDRHTVTWRCLRSNMQDTDAWEGTTITFELHPEPAGGTRIEFVHTGYRDSPCYDACVAGWAFFLGTSLRQYLETGQGVPYPDMQDTQQLQSR
jgi:hypothetical protein